MLRERKKGNLFLMCVDREPYFESNFFFSWKKNEEKPVKNVALVRMLSSRESNGKRNLNVIQYDWEWERASGRERERESRRFN